MNSVFRLAVRKFSSTTAKESGNIPAGLWNVLKIVTQFYHDVTGYAAIKQKQKMFNIDNGLRVHERGGARDAVLYNFTLLCLIVGGGLWVNNVYTMAFPKKG